MTTRSRQRKLRAVKAGESQEAGLPADAVKLEAATAEQLAAMTHLTAKAVLTDGREITLIVPADFGPAELETSIGMLLEVRKAVETAKGARNTGLVAVQRPPLVGANGQPLT